MAVRLLCVVCMLELRFCVVWNCKLERKSYVTAQGTFYSIHQWRFDLMDNQWKVFLYIHSVDIKFSFCYHHHHHQHHHGYYYFIVVVSVDLPGIVHYSSRVLRCLVIQTKAVKVFVFTRFPKR